MTTPPHPELEYRFTIHAQVAEHRRVGDQENGTLYIVPITGGSVVGAGLDGEILPGGADWAVFRPDDAVTVEARYQFQTAAGIVVDVVNTGLARFTSSARDQVGYFATTPTFRTDSAEHRWLLDSVFLGWARSTPQATSIDVFEVLAPVAAPR